MNRVGGGGRMGAWGRLESWLQGVVSDKERLARYFLVAYWISMAFVLAGAALIISFYLGWWGR